MSMVMQDSINWSDIAEMDRLCGKMGIKPPPVRDWVKQLDFDPDAVLRQVDQLKQAEAQVRAAAPALDQAKPTEGVWTGESSTLLMEHSECQRSFWGHVGDFLLWLVENIIQIVDYIVDILRIVVAWITWIATAICAAAAVIIIVVAAVGGAGIGAIFGALVDSVVLAVGGAIAILGLLISLLLAGLNWCIEWLQQVIRDARAKICGKGLPSLPDWDPTGWEPPAWPI